MLDDDAKQRTCHRRGRSAGKSRPFQHFRRAGAFAESTAGANSTKNERLVRRMHGRAVKSQREAAVNGDGQRRTSWKSPRTPATDATPRRRRPPEDGMGRELGAILDEALDRMERRVVGDERPIPLPWSNVSAALGGGLWGGTLVTLVGDTGSGKTQWALQLSVHAAEYGVPVCYVGPDSGVDQIAARLLALKSGQKWSDLYAGRSDKETLDTLRMGYAQAMKALPFHIIGRSARRDQPHDVRGTAEWMRRRYPRGEAGDAAVPDGPRLRADRERHEPRRDQGDDGAHRPRRPPGGQGLRRRRAAGVHHAPGDARRRRRDHRHPPRPPTAREAGPGKPGPPGDGGQGGKARSSARATR